MNQEKLVIIGIDWADAKHDFHTIDTDGRSTTGVFTQSPKAIAAQLDHWRKQFPAARFAVAIETSKGALINALTAHQDIVIYPINPAALASYRKAMAHGGGKSDPIDAKLLAQFLLYHRDTLRPITPNSDTTRKLDVMTKARRTLVNQRADVSNQLTALLKTYFPAALALKPARSYSEWFLFFLIKFTHLAAAQSTGATKLRNYFHGLGQKKDAADHAGSLKDAVALTDDPVTIQLSVMNLQTLVAQLQLLSKHIKLYDKQLASLVPTHDSFAVVRGLPGAKTNTHARILAALGDDRSRYADAASLQAATGIAPVTTASGKSRYVNARWACTKFLRQTFHEYAGNSLKKSRWAKAYYDQQRAKGNSAQVAKRALAYKWQRIIFRLWQTGETYDEARYIERLRQTGSPLWAALQNAPLATVENTFVTAPIPVDKK